jgi:hypothetical protein
MFSSFLWRQLSRCWWLIAAVLAGCEKPDVAVNIHGVNYKGDAFSYYVADPARPDSGAGGELIDAFAAGGTTCCFTLPKIWRPGIKVQISTTHWLPKLPDNSLPEVKETHIAEVPRYADGKPGELWVLRMADGGIGLVSSDVQPDHEKWPGKVKGWPVPSLEYQRERWELLREHKRDFVEAHVSLLRGLEESPRGAARQAWAHAKEYEPSSLTGFTGPEDPRYIVALRKEYEEGLKEAQQELKKFEGTRP